MTGKLKIDGSLNIIPIIGGTLIFSSLVFNLAYYSIFKISITNYLSLSEILILFFEDIIPLAFYIILVISFTSFPSFINSNATKKNKTSRPIFSYRSIVQSIPGLLFLAFSAVLYIYTMHYFPKINIELLPVVYVTLFSSFLFGLKMTWKHIEDQFWWFREGL